MTRCRFILWAATGLCLVAGMALGDAPDRSVFPTPRPTVVDPVRPDQFVRIVGGNGVMVSLRPVTRPGSFRAGNSGLPTNRRSNTASPVAVTSKGAICGVNGIRGENLAPIPGRLAGCGVDRPVRVFSVSGVALSQGAIMDCQTAKTLNAWVKTAVKPTVGRLGGGVASLQVAAHYACRTRNSKPGAKISEHGKGHAIDISAVNLRNGVAIRVQGGWNDPAQGKILRRLHGAACGPFGTVLGPNADRYHQDHFHLDTARYRSGSYCR